MAALDKNMLATASFLRLASTELPEEMEDFSKRAAMPGKRAPVCVIAAAAIIVATTSRLSSEGRLAATRNMPCKRLAVLVGLVGVCGVGIGGASRRIGIF